MHDASDETADDDDTHIIPVIVGSTEADYKTTSRRYYHSTRDDRYSCMDDSIHLVLEDPRRSRCHLSSAAGLASLLILSLIHI